MENIVQLSKLIFVCVLPFVMLITGIDAIEGTVRHSVIEEVENCDRKTSDGDVLVISYTGQYTDNAEQFDDSESRNEPFYFTMGGGSVMPGWEHSLRMMCVGEIREIFISGSEAEGHEKSGAIVPDLTRGEIMYTIKLVQIMDKPPTPNLFKKMDFDGDKMISKTEMKAFFSAQGLGGLKDDESLESAVENIFNFQDKNDDGVISFEEFPGQKHDEL